MGSRVRAWIPVVAAAAYVAFLVWQAPHTVHHFFEHDAEKQNECALGAAAERAAGTTPTTLSLAPVAGHELALAVVAPDVCARPIRSVLGPRAPPSPAA
jgi:hypothetical protein